MLADSTTETVAFGSPGTTSQDNTDPGRAPSNFATVSGTVVRTDFVPFSARDTFDRNSNGSVTKEPTMHMARRAINVAIHECHARGRSIGQSLLLCYGVWQLLAIVSDLGRPGADESLGERANRLLKLGFVTRALGTASWQVRSESNPHHSYIVRRRYEVWTCSCPAGSVGSPCKHVAACQILQGETPPEAVVGSHRRSYRQDWSAYDLGQTQELSLIQRLLSELASTIPEVTRLPGKGGRPPVPEHDQIFGAVFKVWSGKSGRRAGGFWDTAVASDLLERPLGRMTIQRALNREDLTPVLSNLVTLSALPLAGLEEGEAVAPDSTGIQTTSFGAWRETSHDEQRFRRWLKVHAMVGTKTHVVIRALVGDENSGDAPQFAPLLRWTLEAGFRPGSVVADKGYLSKENYRLATELGVEAFIPFKSNSRNRSGTHGSPLAWRKAFYLFQAMRDEFERGYHRRSNVESVFSALKRKFGEDIKSRTSVAQVNEVYCKLIAYNLSVVVHEMFEHGIAPDFTAGPHPSITESGTVS
jgi:transposase